MVEIKEVDTEKTTVIAGEHIRISYEVWYDVDYPYDYPYDYPISSKQK